MDSAAGSVSHPAPRSPRKHSALDSPGLRWTRADLRRCVQMSYGARMLPSTRTCEGEAAGSPVAVERATSGPFPAGKTLKRELRKPFWKRRRSESDARRGEGSQRRAQTKLPPGESSHSLSARHRSEDERSIIGVHPRRRGAPRSRMACGAGPPPSTGTPPGAPCCLPREGEPGSRPCQGARPGAPGMHRHPSGP
jgi:hypothetical protein